MKKLAQLRRAKAVNAAENPNEGSSAVQTADDVFVAEEEDDKKSECDETPRISSLYSSRSGDRASPDVSVSS